MQEPLIIDIHIHGAGGYSFAKDPERASDVLIKNGIHKFLATLVCLPYNKMEQALSKIREFMAKDNKGGLLGVYIEGPFINPEKAGGMDPNVIKSWTLKDFKTIIERFADIIKIVTVAPELSFFDEVTSILKANSIAIAIGHTNADFATTVKAIKKGAVLFTHLFNATTQFHHRAPGAAVAALLEEDVFCELIPQWNHLHPKTVELVLRIKPEKTIFVSDATPLCLSSKEIHTFSGKRVFKKNGACFTEDNRLFGSAITLKEGFTNLKESRLFKTEEDALLFNYKNTLSLLKRLNL